MARPWAKQLSVQPLFFWSSPSRRLCRPVSVPSPRCFLRWQRCRRSAAVPSACSLVDRTCSGRSDASSSRTHLSSPARLHHCFWPHHHYHHHIIIMLFAWHSGKTLVFDRWTFPVPLSTCSWRVTTYVGKTSATGQPTRPTQPFILSGSINWVVSYFIGCVPVAPFSECSRCLAVWLINRCAPYVAAVLTRA